MPMYGLRPSGNICWLGKLSESWFGLHLEAPRVNRRFRRLAGQCVITQHSQTQQISLLQHTQDGPAARSIMLKTHNLFSSYRLFAHIQTHSGHAASRYMHPPPAQRMRLQDARAHDLEGDKVWVTPTLQQGLLVLAQPTCHTPLPLPGPTPHNDPDPGPPAGCWWWRATPLLLTAGC